MNNLVATVRPDYPGLTKPVVAGQTAETRRPETPAALPEAPKSPEGQKPATTGDVKQTGVAEEKKPVPVSTAQANLAAAPAAGGK